MPNYKLKPNVPDFEVVDGPQAGRKFKSGQVYTDVPMEEKSKFEIIPSPNRERFTKVGEADRPDQSEAIKPAQIKEPAGEKYKGGKES